MGYGYNLVLITRFMYHDKIVTHHILSTPLKYGHAKLITSFQKKKKKVNE